MLMLCIIGTALMMLTSAAMPTGSDRHFGTGHPKAVNKTEHTFLRTVEVMHDSHEEMIQAPRNTSQEAAGPQEAPGEHAILIFFLCRIFLTAVWGSILALLTVALRVDMCERALEMPQSSAPKRTEIGMLKGTPPPIREQ